MPIGQWLFSHSDVIVTFVCVLVKSVRVELLFVFILMLFSRSPWNSIGDQDRVVKLGNESN